MEDCIDLLESGDPGRAYHGADEYFSKLHCRKAFSIFSNSHGFANPARKKVRFDGRSQSVKGFSYQRIIHGEEETTVEGRRKRSNFRLHIKRKRWAFRLPRARISPLFGMLRRARDSYMKLLRNMYQNTGYIVFDAQWGIPSFYQPCYL